MEFPGVGGSILARSQKLNYWNFGGLLESEKKSSLWSSYENFIELHLVLHITAKIT